MKEEDKAAPTTVQHERQPTLWKLRFLYIGSRDVEKDARYYHDVVGAEILWSVEDSGTTVAAVRVSGESVVLLLADHQPVPSCEPIFEVNDLRDTEAALRKRGWEPEGGSPFEIPNGPCFVFKDPSGNRIAVFQDVRPNVMRHITEGD